jgi:hypothetical protein
VVVVAARLRGAPDRRSHRHARDAFELAAAEELLLGYHLRWHEEPLDTEHAELEFDVPLINPATGRASRTFTLRGKVDAKVIDRRDGRAYLVEHKTTSQDITEGSGYWQRLRMDGQVSVYYGAFPDVAGCIYDVIRRPQLRPLKATPAESRRYTAKGALYANQRAEDESVDDYRQRVRDSIAEKPDEYFKRGVVVRLDSEIQENQYDLWQQADIMRESMAAGVHPRNPDACMRYGSQCDYFDVCTGVSSLDDDRLFKIRDAHPELTTPQEATR